MTEPRAIILEVIKASQIESKLTQAVMRITGCDGSFAEQNPVDYVKALEIYQKATVNYLYKIMDKAIETDEEAQQIIEMLSSEQFKKYESIIAAAAEGNPYEIAEDIIDNKETPESLLKYLYEQKIKPVRKDPISSLIKKVAQSDDIPVKTIKIETPEDIVKLKETLENIGNGEDGEKAMEDLVNELQKGPDEHDCKTCSEEDCENRVAAPKKPLLN